jgi:hypothetical protein
MKSHSVFAAALVLAAATAQAQTVKVEFLMGKVNLTAQNASVRTIINEWARVGGARVINPERLSAAPVTLQLTGVPERQALDILLRDVGGYMLGPRQTELVPGVSAFDRLMVVTATAGPAPRPAPAGSFNQAQRPVTQNPPFRRPPVAAPSEPEGESEPINEPQPDEPAQGGVPNRQNVRPAVMPPLPQAEAPPPPAPAPAPTPGNPFGAQGVSRPGIITPVPQPTPPQQRPPNE